MNHSKKNVLFAVLLLTGFMLCACDVEWVGWDGEHNSDPNPERISASTTATVDAIYTDEMDVITDDDVVLTCDLPSDPVLAEGDRVEIIIDFKSEYDDWFIMDVQFYQKI